MRIQTRPPGRRIRSGNRIRRRSRESLLKAEGTQHAGSGDTC